MGPGRRNAPRFLSGLLALAALVGHHRFMRMSIVVGVVWAVESGALGQALNIDIGPTGSSVPSEMFGGAASQPGYWNLDDGSGQFLRDSSGNLTSARAGIQGSTPAALSIDGIGPGDKELMESMLFGDRNSMTSVGVLGLVPGDYRLYLHAWSPIDDPNRTESRIAIDETTSGYFSVVGTNFNNIWGGQALGVSYAVADVTVQQSGGLLLFTLMSLGNGEDSPVSVLNGIQIVPIPAPGAGVIAGVAAVWSTRRRRVG